MDNDLMIEKLKKIGIQFAHGLSDHEIKKIEVAFGFHFPKEVACFLSCAYPAGLHFFNYRDMSIRNIQAFNDFQQNIKESFLFDIEHNTASMQAMLKEAVGNHSDKDTFKSAVVTALEQSPRLIPFYAHRCFFDGMDGMPIVSFWQAVDTIFYGSDFENYLENEFLCPKGDNHLCKISDKMRDTGIWYHVIG